MFDVDSFADGEDTELLVAAGHYVGRTGGISRGWHKGGRAGIDNSGRGVLDSGIRRNDIDI